MADIDYAALAKQAGAVSSQPASGVDYAALAKQSGAVASTPAGSGPSVAPRNILDDPKNQYVGESNGIPVYKHDHPEGAAGAFDAFWEGVGGKALVDMWPGEGRSPEQIQRAKDTARSLVRGIAAEPGRVWGELSEAGRAMLKADLPSFAYHAGGSVPLIGAPAQQVAVDFSNGDYSRGFGHAFGLLLPFMSGALPKDLKIAPVKSKLNPVVQRAVDFAERKNIPLPVSVQTGGRFARGLEGLVESDLGGSGYAAKARQATSEAIQQTGQDLANEAYPQSVPPGQAGRVIQNTVRADLEGEGATLANQVHPTPSNPEIAGAKVDRTFQSKIGEKGKLAKAEYQTVAKIEADPFNKRSVPVSDEKGNPIYNQDGSRMTEDMPLPVDFTDLKDALLPLYDRYVYTMSETDARASVGLKAIRQIINGPDFKPASAAEMDLGLLKEAARSELPELKDVSQGLATAALKELQNQIDSAVGGAHVPGFDPAGGGMHPGLAALRAGRQLTAEKWDLADLRKSFGPLDRTEPVSVFGQLTWGKDAGVQRLRKVAKVAPDLIPEIGRAYIDSGANWKNLGPATKQELFRDPQLIDALDRHYATAEKMRPLLAADEPVNVFQRLTWGKDSAVEQLQRVAQKAPADVPKIGRAYVEGLLETATRAGDFEKTQQILNQWDELGPQTKKLLFRYPALISDLDNFFVLARKAAINPNPSGTAFVSAIGSHVATLAAGAGMMIFSPTTGAATAIGGEIAHVIGNAGLARLLFSPAGSKALLKGLTVPVRTPAGAAAAATILRLAGKDAKRVDQSQETGR